MGRQRAASWVHDLVDEWAGDAMTGVLELEYLSGSVKKAWRRDCVVAPPDVANETANAKVRMTCPDCRVPLARERDHHGQRFDCAKCGKTWSYWDLKQRMPGASEA